MRTPPGAGVVLTSHKLCTDEPRGAPQHWCAVVQERVNQIQEEHDAVQAAVRRVVAVPEVQPAGTSPLRLQGPSQRDPDCPAGVAAECLRAMRN